MPQEKLRAIIFDIGRVLVRVDVSRAMAGLAENPRLSPREIWSAIEKDPRWADWQEGRIAPRDWHRHIAHKLGGGLSFKQFCEVWNRALSPEPILDDALLALLARSYRLAVLSNSDPVHVAHLEANFSFFKHFPRRIYSCVVRSSKPNPLIYKQALRTCGVRAEEALYVDDVAEYAQAAERLGMRGIVFESPTQLLAELTRHGIATGQP